MSLSKDSASLFFTQHGHWHTSSCQSMLSMVLVQSSVNGANDSVKSAKNSVKSVKNSVKSAKNSVKSI